MITKFSNFKGSRKELMTIISTLEKESPENYKMYVELDGNYTNIKEDSTIVFEMNGSDMKEFSVFIGNIVPQEPENLMATGHYNSITLEWDSGCPPDSTGNCLNEDLGDIRNRYPATCYNVYRDDEPLDPNSNAGAPGNGPGGCGADGSEAGLDVDGLDQSGTEILIDIVLVT